MGVDDNDADAAAAAPNAAAAAAAAADDEHDDDDDDDNNNEDARAPPVLRTPPPPSPASHQPSHVARVKVSRVFCFLFLFAAARVPARCASSSPPQQNINFTTRGAHHSSR